MEKILLACLGAYLELSGIFAVLVETECYSDVIKTVISGSHYSRAHTAHLMIHEVLMSMTLEGFLSEFPKKRMELEALATIRLSIRHDPSSLSSLCQGKGITITIIKLLEHVHICF